MMSRLTGTLSRLDFRLSDLAVRFIPLGSVLFCCEYTTVFNGCQVNFYKLPFFSGTVIVYRCI